MTLWRALALAWLGGIASPALSDDFSALGDTLSAAIEPSAAPALPDCETSGVSDHEEAIHTASGS